MIASQLTTTSWHSRWISRTAFCMNTDWIVCSTTWHALSLGRTSEWDWAWCTLFACRLYQLFLPGISSFFPRRVFYQALHGTRMTGMFHLVWPIFTNIPVPLIQACLSPSSFFSSSAYFLRTIGERLTAARSEVLYKLSHSEIRRALVLFITTRPNDMNAFLLPHYRVQTVVLRCGLILRYGVEEESLAIRKSVMHT